MAAHRSSRQITYKKLHGWTCEVVKVTVQNCGRALVKPKNQPGGTRPKFRLETNSAVVWLNAGGVSLILPDMRFEMVSLD